MSNAGATRHQAPVVSSANVQAAGGLPHGGPLVSGVRRLSLLWCGGRGSAKTAPLQAAPGDLSCYFPGTAGSLLPDTRQSKAAGGPISHTAASWQAWTID
jgi:hypothetical protein